MRTASGDSTPSNVSQFTHGGRFSSMYAKLLS